MSKHFRVPGRLAARLQESGIRLSCCCKTRASPGLFDQPRILVTTEELFALWRGIGQASTNPASVSIWAPRPSRNTSIRSPWRPFPRRASAKPCVRWRATNNSPARKRFIHETDDEEWSIQFRWLLADGVEPDVLTDFCFAWVLCIARHGTGTRLSPLRLELARPPAHAKILGRHFGCPVVFGAARNAIVFRARMPLCPLSPATPSSWPCSRRNSTKN